MASSCSSPSDMSLQPKNSQSHPSPLRASPNTTTSPINNKKQQAKAQWTANEEVTLVTVLSDQKCVRNSSESGFKGTVWRMVEATVRDIGEELGKNSKQCKA